VCVCMYVVGGGDFSEPSECDCGSCEGCWVTGAIYAERRCFRVSGEQEKVQLMVVGGCCVDGLGRMVVSSRLEGEGNIGKGSTESDRGVKKKL